MRRDCVKRIDTHAHVLMSKHFHFDPAIVTRFASMARRVGLDGIAFTEHLHARAYWEIYRYLADHHPVERGMFRVDGVAVVPGAEVNVREGAHVIVLAEVDEIRQMDRAFPGLLSAGYEPTFREFLDVTDDLDLVRIGAHMFRREKELGKFPVSDLRRLHALEINGKDFGTETMLLVQARALGLPIVAGSDAHFWLQLGVRHTVVHGDELAVPTLMKTIREGLTGFATSPYTPARVSLSKSLKTITKQLRKCYGDRPGAAGGGRGRLQPASAPSASPTPG
jgi:hypothetical protein